ncbi:MAG: dockerin type I domain-containing protein, partial [Planctomycetota bacterium]
STTLTSPLLDATVTKDQLAVLSYFRWLDNGGEGDELTVEISNNNGASWVTIETVGSNAADSTGGWIEKTFAITDFVAPTAQMRVRFTAGDLNDPSVVEAGIDAVGIDIVECGGVLLGDVNLDGVVDLLDVAPFVDLISFGKYQVEADLNEDGAVNILDVQLFVQLLSNG